MAAVTINSGVHGPSSMRHATASDSGYLTSHRQNVCGMNGEARLRRAIWHRESRCGFNRRRSDTSPTRSPKHSVIPGRREAASPESIATSLSNQTNAGQYRFRAPAFGRPRNDGCGLRNAPSSMRGDVTYGENVIYDESEPAAACVPYGNTSAPGFCIRATLCNSRVIYARDVTYAARPRTRRVKSERAGGITDPARHRAT
jgi:hypothetical protein